MVAPRPVPLCIRSANETQADMELKVSWPVIGGAAVVYYATLVFYRLFLHPLARFPGPRLAAISRWYEGYYDVILDGQYTSKIVNLHEVYGVVFPKFRFAHFLTF